VNSQIDSSTGGNNGVGFAIPIDTVKQFTGQLISNGSVQHAFLGVRIATQGGGAKVATVEPGSAAAKAGLKVGDVVLAVDSKAVRSSDQLRAAIAAHKPGDKITLRVSRSGHVQTVGVTLGTRS
jgi:putative serine protease PepD